MNVLARSLDITPMGPSAYTPGMNAIGFGADKSYIGQKDARLKRIFRPDCKKAKELSNTQINHKDGIEPGDGCRIFPTEAARVFGFGSAP